MSVVTLFATVPFDDALEIGRTRSFANCTKVAAALYTKRDLAADMCHQMPYVEQHEPPVDGSPTPDPTVHITASVVMVEIEQAMFDMFVADGTLLLEDGWFYRIGDPEALLQSTLRVTVELCPRFYVNADMVTLYGVYCQQDKGDTHRGGYVQAQFLSACDDSAFDAKAMPLRLFSTREAALGSLKTRRMRPDDEIGLVEVTLPQPTFPIVVKTCQDHPARGYIVPPALMPLLQVNSVITAELIARETLVA